MTGYQYYIPSDDEIREECELIRANRSPDVKVPIHFYDYIKLYVDHDELIQNQAEDDGMPIKEMLGDEIRFVFYLLNRSLGASKNFRCFKCNEINDGFSKLCKKCSYKKSAEQKRLREAALLDND